MSEPAEPKLTDTQLQSSLALHSAANMWSSCPRISKAGPLRPALAQSPLPKLDVTG
jgi:hypothetical protein